MHRTVYVALGGTALTLGAFVALPGVALANHCAPGQVHVPYSGACANPPGGTIVGQTGGGASGAPATGGGSATGSNTTGAGTASTNRSAASSLPFTGDEVLVLTLAGAGALAAGSALVVAGRRRRTPSA